MVPSMMIPKSMAPMERRLAASPVRCRKMKANRSAKGIVRAVMIAARALTRKKIRTRRTKAIPRIKFHSTVSVVTRTRSLRS